MEKAFLPFRNSYFYLKKTTKQTRPYGIISPLKKAKGRGRVVWLIAHAWNVCNLHGFAGSNPALSAKTVKGTIFRVLDFLIHMLYFAEIYEKTILAIP